MATQPAEVIDAPIIETPIEEQAPARDFEAEARIRGWRSEEEWPEGKPKPAKFKSAEEFIAAEDEHFGLLKKKYDHQERELKELKRAVRLLSKSEQAAHEARLEALKAKAEAAVESGDLAAYRKVDTQIDALRKDVEADTDHGEDPDEQYIAFREANAWYDRANLNSASEVEVEARLYADRLADKYAKQGMTAEMPPSEFFARIARETEERFPLLKAKKARAKPDSAVAGVTPNGGQRNAKIGANLPAEAKEHARRYMAMGIYRDCKTEAEAYDRFAKDFDWSKA